MDIFIRGIEKMLRKSLFQNKVIILYGARQVGKTTFSKHLLTSFQESGAYFNCEIPSVQNGLTTKEPQQLRAFLGNHTLIFLDEAQVIPEIGKKLKLLIDTFPEMQIVATGSSSFDLAEQTAEPLTGRSQTFLLYPLSISELAKAWGVPEVESRLENLLRFGTYPAILSLSEEDARGRLDEIVSQYLYKDVLQFGGLRKPAIIRDLVTLLALQLGQEVSYHELATQLGINRVTVEKYIDMLEKAFVVFRLRAFARNQRKEIRTSVKIYFYDLGIRNSIIQNYNALERRADVGALWENFCIVERIKSDNESARHPNRYFWRTYDQKEVDYVEERDGVVSGFEFTWNEKRTKKPPREFIQAYDASVTVIHRENYLNFLIGSDG